jgi:hypothetical protein
MNAKALVIIFVFTMVTLYLAKGGHFGLAFLLLLGMFGYGVWRIVSAAREMREQRERQWTQIDWPGQDKR